MRGLRIRSLRVRSLRVRFFLTVWPLVVGTTVVVGLLLSRWVAVELVQEHRPGAAPAPAVLSDSGAARWAALRTLPDTDARRALRAVGRELDVPNDIVALDPRGNTLGTTDAAAEVVDVGERTVDVRRSLGGGRMRQHFVLLRVPVRARDGRPLGAIVPLPPAATPPPPVAEGAYRRIWSAVALASVIAALATFLLAAPVIRRVRTLRDAAVDIADGDYTRRVAPARVAATRGDELAELESSFDAMAARLEQSEAVKRRMISDIAHELRTPLTNIVGLVEAMRDGLRAPDAAALVSTAEEAQLLTRLIDELQELSLAEARALRFEPVPTVLADEVRRTVDAFRGATGDTSLVVASEDDGVMVDVDRGRLGQILRNLVRNAVTHTPPGGEVRVRVFAERDDAVVQVVDRGPGIAADDLPLIWERFHRLDPSRQRATGGMGLGLPLARELTVAMRGTIGATSEPGVGSTFEVRFPRLRDVRAAAFIRS